MKNRLVTMLAAMLSVGCLVACSTSEGSKNTDNVTGSTVSTETQTTVSETEKNETTESTETKKEETTGLAEGIYDIEVESDSSMFKIEKATLTVSEDEMTAVITLGGTGYGKLFVGSAEEAAAAEDTEWILFEEDANGAYTYTLPVEALDQPIAYAAFSNKKEEWYDRQLTFLSASAKEPSGETIDTTETTQTEAETETAKAEVGTYSIEVTLEGGSGKTTVVSPAVLTVTEDGMTATIEWSSPNYDYMLVDGEKYLPVNTEGNSVFEIPVAKLDTALEVIGDTVAMSKPKEIEYTLTFHSNTMKASEE